MKLIKWLYACKNFLHGRFIHEKRVDYLASRVSLLIEGVRGLDVGTGDGRIPRRIEELKSGVSISGVDVPNTVHGGNVFDGCTLPYENSSFDFILLIDVLHHADNPSLLLKECLRVTRGKIIIKDHLCENLYDRIRLILLDWAGNASKGINMPYHFFSMREWEALFSECGLFVMQKNNLPIYKWPLSILAGEKLQVLFELKKIS